MSVQHLDKFSYLCSEQTTRLFSWTELRIDWVKTDSFASGSWGEVIWKRSGNTPCLFFLGGGSEVSFHFWVHVSPPHHNFGTLPAAQNASAVLKLQEHKNVRCTVDICRSKQQMATWQHALAGLCQKSGKNFVFTPEHRGSCRICRALCQKVQIPTYLRCWNLPKALYSACNRMILAKVSWPRNICIWENPGSAPEMMFGQLLERKTFPVWNIIDSISGKMARACFASLPPNQL